MDKVQEAIKQVGDNMNAIVTLCDYQRLTSLNYITGAIRGDGCWSGDLWAIMQGCKHHAIIMQLRQ